VSPDGRNIVFAASGSDGKRFVWLRALDALEQRPLSGSDGAQRPFWSPDSRFVAFVAEGKLKKIDIAGGPAQIICDAPTGSDGSWSPEGVILFDGRGSDPIWRVPASGGVAKVEVGPEKFDGVVGAAGWPMFLPDGRHFLYMTLGGDGSEQTLRVRALDSAESKPLFKTTSRVVYAEPGYLLYVRDQTLVAHRFNPRSFTVEGEPIPVGDGLGVDSVGLASFSVSRNGVLAFRAGEQQGRLLLWVDRAGKESPASDAEGDYNDFVLSPDGKRLAFDSTGSQGRGDIWVRDLTRGVTSRFTFDTADETAPLWSPDGRRILYTSRAKGPGDLYLKDAAGTREPEVLLATPEVKYASDWSPDGKYVLFTNQTTGSGWDIFALPLGGDRKPFPIVKTKFDELFAAFSPDGRYVAYMSAESGRMQVYVQEFPDARNKWQVSTDGGSEPSWRGDGRELFYRSRDRVMAVAVQTGDTFTVGTPAELFKTRFAQVIVRAHYRPAPDGQRFLVLAPLGRDAIQPTAVVLNWTAAVRQ
jgi:Tol biopolymer transport system component